jgi:hypothetical protein
VLLTAGLAAYCAATTHAVPGLVDLIAGFGVLLVVAAVFGVWEDGLTFGPALLLVAYTVSITADRQPIELSAAFVAGSLLALVDLGSWSLELGDGVEERPFAHLRTLVVLTVGAFAASLLVLLVGSATAGGGIGLWILGAAAALGLFLLLGRPTPAEPE